MTRLPMTIAAAALLCGTAAVAQMKPAPKPTAKATVAAKTVTTVKPAPVAAAKPAPRAKVATTGRMVTTKTSTGKAITYNCSLAGNKTKKVCQ